MQPSTTNPPFTWALSSTWFLPDLNNAFPQDLLQTAVQQDQAAISQSLQDCCGVELVGVAAATPVTNSPVDTSEQTGLVGWELALVVTAVTIACAGALLCGMIYCNRWVPIGGSQSPVLLPTWRYRKTFSQWERSF